MNIPFVSTDIIVCYLTYNFFIKFQSYCVTSIFVSPNMFWFVMDNRFWHDRYLKMFCGRIIFNPNQFCIQIGRKSSYNIKASIAMRGGNCRLAINCLIIDFGTKTIRKLFLLSKIDKVKLSFATPWYSNLIILPLNLAMSMLLVI